MRAHGETWRLERANEIEAAYVFDKSTKLFQLVRPTGP